MRIAAALAAVLVIGCGGKSKGPATGTGGGGQETGSGGGGQETGGGGTETASTMPPPAGFAEADAISIDGGEIITWSFAGGKVTQLGATKLGDPDPEDWNAALDGDWGDREHFFVHVPPRTVLRVTAKGITPVPVPPEKAFTTPRPASDDENLTEGGVMEGRNFGLVVTEGNAYWSECPWGMPYDGWVCEVYMTAELWPGTDLVKDEKGVRPHEWSWPGAKVPGFRVKELDEGRILGCTPRSGTAYKQTQMKGKEEDGEHVHTVEWVSAEPPRMLLIWGTPGFADLVPSRWELHDGCKEQPLLGGESAEAGPSGYWLGDSTIYKGADALGPIKGDVKFRPPT